MFDTIKFRYDHSGLSGEEIERFIGRLDRHKKTEDVYGVRYSGEYENLYFTVNQNHIYMSGGSLCKHYFGNNIQTLTRMETKEAIEMMNDELKIDFSGAIITRIDGAHNIPVEHPVGLYYEYMGGLQYFSKQPQPDGLYYQKGNRNSRKRRTNLFYDKIKELIYNRVYIPEEYKNLNLLRYEVRLMSGIPGFFNTPSFTLSDLYNENHFNQMVEYWKDEYLRINKINCVMSDFEPTGSTKDLKNYLSAIALSELTMERILVEIKVWQDTGKINKEQAKRLRDAVKGLNTNQKVNEKSELIQELDSKIIEIAKWCR